MQLLKLIKYTPKQPLPVKGKPWLKYTFALLLLLCLSLTSLHLLFPLKLNIDYSPVITAADGTVINAFLSRDEKWRMQLEKEEISPVLKQAVLLKEDRYFYYHPGINPFAMGRALFNNITKGKTTSGASTITMQVARLLYPKKRTYWHKLTEVGRALQLEWTYSKEEILLLYLNLVPFGGNIEGVKAASVLYFQQSPAELSLAQAVTLAVIPNKPSSLRIGVQNERIITFRNKWLRYYLQHGAFSADAVEDALQEPLEAARQEAPRIAPHFAYRMFRKHRDQAIIKTTLNPPTQKMVEQLAFNYLQRLRFKNIHNVSVLVINNQTNSVEAYLGSADFTDAAHGGQVDGVRAIRSPGSTLKPLLYAAAMDKGLLTPKSIISDVPVDYAGYRPENYFGTYNGQITIAHALATSLNVPAVKVLDQLGVQSFVQKMAEAEFKQVKKEGSQLGLSLILGGCGVKLEELTMLYAAFARQGLYSPIKWLQHDTLIITKQLVTPASAHMVTQILTQLTRPDLPHNSHNSSRLPKIAWKTGTSYGRKDAWSIGYNKKYTIGVWVGNFSGEGVPELNGTDSATPLLFDIFDSLDYNGSDNWFTAPESLKHRSVCAASGKPVNSFCTNHTIDTYIPGVSDVTKCEHLKQVMTSSDEKYAFCTTCLPDQGVVQKWYPNYAPDILSFFEAEYIPYKKIPAHNPYCSRIFYENAPAITSPTAEMEYILEREEHQQLQLHCNAHNEVKQVYWYINDKFYRTGAVNEQIFFEPKKAGKFKISCTDDQGRNADSYITVRFIN